MCGGHGKRTSPATGMEADDRAEVKASFEAASLLLELAASDNLDAFKRAVEEDGLPVDAAAPWYGRCSSGVMGYQHRTPLMIAALYGSSALTRYILSTWPAEAAHRSATDGAIALHCAAAGGSLSSLEVVKLLIAASPESVDALDESGSRPGDVIACQFSNAAVKSLEVILKSSPCPRVPSPGKELEIKQSEKKEYPPDLTLPDINSGIYSTDEFRMYAFKIKPCSRAYAHDWTECPFAHPGENARRRDPRKHSYSCVPCPEFRKGSCRNGDACEYAHGVFESWLHPAQYRTRLCKDENGCNRRVCFFAHKPEEVRKVNPSAASIAGTVLPSPKSSPPGPSSLDMATALMLMQQSNSSMSSLKGGGVTPPPLKLPSGRLKASMSARNMDLDIDLLGLEAYQQKLIDDTKRITSPRSKWGTNNLSAAGSSEFNQLLGSVHPSMLAHLQGLSLRQGGGSMQQYQMQPGRGVSASSSPPVSATSSFGLDHSTARAIMNSKASAFAKRSLSFCDRGATAGRQSTLSAMTTATTASLPPMSDWGSPDGKLDWSVQGEELSKLRKSASFAFRGNQAMHGGAASATAAAGLNEPDLSWVQSLVKDGPETSLHQQHNGYLHDNGDNFSGSEMFSPWMDEKIMA